ncbi:MAG TPA: zf-HC2 domain-containing protein, partial [Polyangia bacterium]|nr:zf-HC2 domain-containing protein [Polyangia bacterium]
MTCAQVEKLLAELAGGELSGEPARAARSHAQACAACGERLAELEATVLLCRRAGSEPLPDGFALDLHQALATAGPPPTRLPGRLLERLRARLIARPLAALLTVAAAAAGVAALATARLVGARAPVMTAALPSHRVPAQKVALVKVDFVADAAIDEVRFEILLPDGLRFYSGGRELAERSFQWQGR